MTRNAEKLAYALMAVIWLPLLAIVLACSPWGAIQYTYLAMTVAGVATFAAIERRSIKAGQ